jgi:sterol desaturase/sphingolipid hydroxylase (fatty acid hydroxylase superfamily)
MLGVQFLAGGLGFFTAMVVASLAEYVVHRCMHHGKLLGKTHAEHHRHGLGQGWLGEFCDYSKGSVPLVLSGFMVGYFLLNSLSWGVGFAAGFLVYTALAAYSHQVQHEQPELVFWLPRPIHYLHHKHHMWHHNFGILVDFWDRVFGTYKAVEWKPQRRAFQHPFRLFFRIKWH